MYFVALLSKFVAFAIINIKVGEYLFGVNHSGKWLVGTTLLAMIVTTILVVSNKVSEDIKGKNFKESLLVIKDLILNDLGFQVVSVVVMCFSAGLSFALQSAGMDDLAREQFGTKGAYVSSSGEVFVKKETKFVALGKMPCAKSLKECNEQLQLNPAQIIEKLKSN